MKGLILLANGFEDTEALTTVDVLRRAQIQIDMISVMHHIQVESSHGVGILCDALYEQVNLDEYQFLVIPGGAAVFNHLSKMSIIDETIHHFMNKNQCIAVICAAPILLGKLGYLKNKQYVCFHGCEDVSFQGIYQEKMGVCEDGNIISAKSMYYTIEFALKMIEKIKGKQWAIKVKKEMMSDFSKEE